MTREELLIEKGLVQVATLLKQNNARDAQALCELILRSNSRESRAHHFLGLLAMRQQNLAGAIDHFVLAVQFEPTNALFLNNLGVAHQLRGALPEALASFKKAIRLQNDYAEAFNNQGVVLRQMGKVDEAIAAFDRALKHKPDYRDAQNNRAALLNT